MKTERQAISVKDWINVPDCPIQRNTEKHANKARNRHLKTSSPTHQFVSMAKLPDGRAFKLDGHTRAHLWEDGSLVPFSDPLIVDVYLTPTQIQVEALYKNFDNATASETATDKAYGAMRVMGFAPKSKLLLNGGIRTAIAELTNGPAGDFDIYRHILKFESALRVIDEYDFTTAKFPAAVLAALIATVNIRGETAMPFWVSFACNGGIKMDGEMDAVQAYSELCANMKGRMGKGIERKRLIEAGIAACEAYLSDRMVKRLIGIKIYKYLT